MTRGQEAFSIDFSESSEGLNLVDIKQDELVITNPSNDELQAHDDFISTLKESDTQ